MNRSGSPLVLMALALIPFAGGLAQKPAPAPKRAVVTAVASGMVYVGAGRTDGLKEGVAVQVLRLGDKGRYRVAFVSSHSAACKGDSIAVLPALGDTVEFVPQVEAQVAKYDGTGATATRRSHGAGLRGRIGIRYLSSRDMDNAITLKQPGVELLLDGPVTAGAPVALAVDIRPRRTAMYRPGLDPLVQGISGIYQAAIRFQTTGGPIQAVVGRQYAPTLAGIGLFDGLALNLQHRRWSTGLMAGLAPEAGTLALSSDLRQLGGYFQGRSAPSANLRWSLTAGGMGSYVSGEVNREFGFLQATLNSSAISAIVLQELDYNRGWKRAAGEPSFSPTSSYVSINLMPTRTFSLNAGLDNRRNVRLYQDLATPEQEFDARFRLGMWGGAYLTVARKIRLSGDVRTSTVEGTDSLRTASYSGSVSVDRLTSLGLGFRIRGTGYSTPGRGLGKLFVGAVRVAPKLFSLELSAGSRREAGDLRSYREWLGLDAEFFVKRAWFGLLTYSREWGRDNLSPTTDLLYAGLSYRF